MTLVEGSLACLRLLLGAGRNDIPPPGMRPTPRRNHADLSNLDEGNHCLNLGLSVSLSLCLLTLLLSLVLILILSWGLSLRRSRLLIRPLEGA
jgi:hypothetical protein